MTKIVFCVEECYQVLYSGTWEDGHWDWECKYHEFKTRSEADKYLDSLPITDDMPIARYWQRTYMWDGEAWDYDDGDILRERIQGGK